VAGLEACKTKRTSGYSLVIIKIVIMKSFKLVGKKRLLPFLFLIITGSIAFAQGNAGDKLYVNNPNGTSINFALDDVDKLTFTGEEVTVHLATGATPFLYAAIESITFVEKYSAGLQTPDFKTVKVFYDAAKNLVIESSEALASVAIYNLQGVQLQSRQLSGLSATLPFASYPVGVYPVLVRNSEGKISIHKILIY
jgi:hypothetical protein